MFSTTFFFVSQFFLIQVTFRDEAKTDIVLSPLPLYTCPLDSINVSAMTASSSGRIFFGGQNGSMYELKYSAGEGWAGKRLWTVKKY